MARLNASPLFHADACTELLRNVDAAVAKDSIAGESTCALVIVTPEEVFGASVGDSGVWLILENGVHVDLTQAQHRKPLVGSGTAWPVPFRHKREPGTLLLATDGLLKYTSAERIIGVCRERSADGAGQRLIELVQYPSGALPDDVTLILTEI
jgi:serine/threonine protein phosphatase PrpC